MGRDPLSAADEAKLSVSTAAELGFNQGETRAFRGPMSKQRQDVEGGATAIQSGGDTHIVQGYSAGEVQALLNDQAKNIMAANSVTANEVLQQRLADFVERPSSE